MEVSFARVERIVKTLPIGYYAKRKVAVSCDREIDTSFYDPLHDKIVISYQQIAEGLKNTIQITENAIRAMLYHELSHAILTPNDLRMNSIINVFEDERIETHFEGYYMGVDFKQNVREINNYHGEAADPNNPWSVYYNAIRFRDTTPELQEYIDNTMRVCRSISWDIEQRTKESWERITGTPYEPVQFKNDPILILTDEEGNPDQKKNDKKADKIRNPFIFELNVIDRDDDFTKTISILFENFHKKCCGGTAAQSYSGILNPRNVAREDYRYFDRIARNNGINKFGAFHLNLFLDCSGSFCGNQDATNQVLKALTEMESQYKFFTFSVIACGVGQKVLPQNNRALECGGGTELTAEIEKQFREVQRHNAMNYNIVMYDGDADPHKNVTGKANAFGVFDKPNCFIISEESNRKYIEAAVKGARIVYSENYLKELKGNVIKALQLALV